MRKQIQLLRCRNRKSSVKKITNTSVKGGLFFHKGYLLSQQRAHVYIDTRSKYIYMHGSLIYIYIDMFGKKFTR